MDAEDLLYVHRRHDTNASVALRKDLWQGVMPLPLGGAEALAGAALVGKLLAQPRAGYLEDAVVIRPHTDTFLRAVEQRRRDADTMLRS
eukprot:1299484-Prymnesium_polylepis.3